MMAELICALFLHGIPDRLQPLSSRLHIDEAIYNGLNEVEVQAVTCAKTFESNLKENTEQLYIQGDLLKQAKKADEVNAKVLEETLKQTQASFASTRSGICELQIKVHNLIEDCRGQVNAHNQEIEQKNIKIETTKGDIEDLKEKIKLNEEDAANLDRCAKELDDRARELKEAARKKRKRGRKFGFLGAAAGILLAPVTGGASLSVAAAAAGVTVGVNYNDASKCEEEARSCSATASAKRGTANSLKDDVTKMNSNIDRLETELVSSKERIGVLEDAIRALEDVKKMLLSSLGASDDVVDAIQNMDMILKETLLARSGFVTSLNAREGSIAERELENLKTSWERVQKVMENGGRYALQN